MQTKDAKYLTISNAVEKQGTTVDVRNYLNIIFRHWKKIIIFFLVVSTFGTVYSFRSAVEVYVSEAKLLIKIGRESLSMDPMLGISSRGSVRDPLQTELSIIRSRSVAEKIVDEIGLVNFLGGESKEHTSGLAQSRIRDNIINSVSSKIAISARGNIVTLSFAAQRPDFARSVLEAAISAYRDRHIQVHQARDSAEFLRNQSEKLMAVVTQKEKQLRLFCEKYGITLGDQTEQRLYDIIGGLERDLVAVNGDINYSQSTIDWIERKLKERKPTIESSQAAGISSPVVGTIRSHILGLKFQENELTGRYPDNARVLIDMREQIAFAESELEKELKAIESNTGVVMGLDPTYQARIQELETAKTGLHAQASRKQFIIEEMEKEKSKLEKFTNHKTMISKLNNELGIARDEYRHYQDNLQRTNIYTAMDEHKFSNVSIIQPPTTPLYPLKSDKKRNIGLSFLLGLAGGIGLAFLFEFRDDTLKTNEDVHKRLGLPVLISVSHKA